MVAGAVSGWTEYGSITELTPTSRGRFLVKLDVSKNPSGCDDKKVFYRDYFLPGAKEMFTALLEALTSGKKVRVYVTGNCHVKGYSEITSVTIVP